jgi:peptide/nickel transport system permease protein
MSVEPTATITGLRGATGEPRARAARRQSQLAIAWQSLRRDKAALFGAGLVLIAIAMAIAGPWIAPHDPTQQIATMRMAKPFTGDYLLGGDFLGRDILSRLLYGARASMVASLFPVLMSATIGTLLGVIAGYYRGAVDMAISRTLDIFFAFPAILLAIAIVAALGPGLRNALLAITVVTVPSFARLVRSAVLSLREQDFVEAARASGARNYQIIRDQIIPNAIAPIIVYATLESGRVMIFAAGLSFLGLGVRPPNPEWGGMVADGRNVLSLAPWISTIPGIAIFLVALGWNLFGDGVRDALDPRLKM